MPISHLIDNIFIIAASLKNTMIALQKGGGEIKTSSFITHPPEIISNCLFLIKNLTVSLVSSDYSAHL